MAYDDNFIDRTTMLDTCDLAAGDTPGKNVGCKMLGQNEDALTANVNRPLYQLAWNCDQIKSVLDTDKAYVEIASLTAFSGSSIDVDPSGGAAGDINYDGSLYLGESGWSGQEALNTLFRVLDENHKEVVIDDVEVWITSLSGNSVGDEFVTTLTTLNLNATLPSGNYRLVYCVGTTLAELPAYGLMRIGIPGSGTASQKGFYTCGPTGSDADFVGTTAIQDALSVAGVHHLYILDGAYAITGADLVIGTDDRLEGETRSGVTITLDPGYDVSCGAGVVLQNLNFDLSGAAAGTEKVSLSARIIVSNISIDGFYLEVDGSLVETNTIVENISCGGGSRILYITSAINVIIRNLIYDASDTTDSLFYIAGNNKDIILENIHPQSSSTVTNCYGVSFSSGFENIVIRNCHFETGANTALLLNDGVNLQIDNCCFESEKRVLSTSGGINIELSGSIKNCRFVNTATTWHKSEVFKLLITAPTYDVGNEFTIESIYIYDRYCQGNTSNDPPGTGSPTPGIDILLAELENVSGIGLILDRGSLDYVIMNIPWIKFTQCRIQNVKVRHSPAMLVPYDYTGSFADGIIEVLAQSVLKDLSFSLNLYKDPSNPLSTALLYIKGDDYTSISGTDSFTSEVDGFLIRLAFGGYKDSGGLVELGDNAILRRFIWPEDNTLSNSLTSDCIVQITGGSSLIEDFCIHITTIDERIKRIIYVSSGDSIGIKNGKIFIEPDTANHYPWRAIDTVNAAAIHIDNVTIVWGGHMTNTTQKLINAPSTYFCKVTNCTCRINGNLPAASHPVIQLASGSNPTDGDGAIVLGNQVFQEAGMVNGPPDIDPNTVVGYANNVLATASSSIGLPSE